MLSWLLNRVMRCKSGTENALDKIYGCGDNNFKEGG